MEEALIEAVKEVVDLLESIISHVEVLLEHISAGKAYSGQFSDIWGMLTMLRTELVFMGDVVDREAKNKLFRLLGSASDLIKQSRRDFEGGNAHEAERKVRQALELLTQALELTGDLIM